MAKKKISQLPAGSALTGLEIVPIVQTGTTKRITAQDIANLGNASGVEGSGTINRLPKFTASSTIGNSAFFDDGTNQGTETTTAINRFIMSANASIAKIFSFRSGNLPRWAFRVDGTESGANAGADLAIRRYNDAGTFIDAPLSFARATGAATFSSSVTATGNVSSYGQLRLETSAYGSIVVGSRSSETDFQIYNTGNIFRIYDGTADALSIATTGAATFASSVTTGGDLTVSRSSNSTLISTIKNTNTTDTSSRQILDIEAGSVALRLLAIHNDNVYIAPTTAVDTYLGSGYPLILKASGNVGIGTTTPAYKFEVSDGTRTAVINPNASLDGIFLGVKENKPLVFGTNDNERMRITSAGNVGIGTTAPTQKLSVLGNTDLGNQATNVTANGYTTRISGASLQSGALFYGSYGNLILSANNEYTASAKRFMLTNALDATKFAIVRSTNATTDPSFAADGVLASGTADFVINNSGNVGIGTTAPTTKLDIRDSNKVFDAYGNVNIFTSDSFAENIGGSIAFGGASNGGTSPYPFAKIQGYKEGSGSWSGSLIFGTTQSNSALTEKMRITSGGNVLINKSTDAGYKLDVAGTTRLDPAGGEYGLVVGRSSGLTNIKAGSDDGGYLLMDSGDQGGVLGLNWYSVENVILVNGGGRVGVGTSSVDASAKMQIDSTTQGFLVPRMGEGEINSIASPAAGLMVYNTDINHMCMFDGSIWKKFSMSNM